MLLLNLFTFGIYFLTKVRLSARIILSVEILNKMW
uniref:Uncharacterized protein n=1 Tax=Myoviridae sp. ctsip2 TaxID=2826705 RepID=A0A8S5N6E0_9CAUD|nr:MAG TPA: protein of unknown function (DUF4234) [Myoviridae sp. ctsip2]